jgi:hypothetical protein
MQNKIELRRLIAELQARSVVHHHIIMQLVRHEARETSNPHAYLSGLTDDLTKIVDESLPLDDVRTAAMSMRQYLDEFLVTVGAGVVHADGVSAQPFSKPGGQ